MLPLETPLSQNQSLNRIHRRTSRKALIALREDLLDDVFYCHFSLGEGRFATVAAAKDDVGFVHYGIAFCNPVESFSRKEGRSQAKENLRYTKGHSGVLTVEDISSLENKSKFHLCKLSLDTEFLLAPPYWAIS